jgi:hypothetical protein
MKITKDTQGHNLHTKTGKDKQQMPFTAESIEPKTHLDVKKHPAHKLPRPAGGGIEPMVGKHTTNQAPPEFM